MQFGKRFVHPILAKLPLGAEYGFVTPSRIVRFLEDLINHRGKKWNLRGSKIEPPIAHRDDVKPLLHEEEIIDHAPGNIHAVTPNEAEDGKKAIPVKLIVLVNPVIRADKFIRKPEVREFILRVIARDRAPVLLDVLGQVFIVFRR